MDAEDRIDSEVAAVHASMVAQGLISVKQRVSDEEHVVVKRVAGPVPTKSAEERPKMETLVQRVGMQRIHEVLLACEDDERRHGLELAVRPLGQCPCADCAAAASARDAKLPQSVQRYHEQRQC